MGTAEKIPESTRDHIIATLYGQFMGDAIGLLSEFYGKEEAMEVGPQKLEVWSLYHFYSLKTESSQFHYVMTL